MVTVIKGIATPTAMVTVDGESGASNSTAITMQMTIAYKLILYLCVPLLVLIVASAVVLGIFYFKR